jgi:hypothetical protein
VVGQRGVGGDRGVRRGQGRLVRGRRVACVNARPSESCGVALCGLVWKVDFHLVLPSALGRVGARQMGAACAAARRSSWRTAGNVHGGPPHMWRSMASWRRPRVKLDRFCRTGLRPVAAGLAETCAQVVRDKDDRSAATVGYDSG